MTPHEYNIIQNITDIIKNKGITSAPNAYLLTAQLSPLYGSSWLDCKQD